MTVPRFIDMFAVISVNIEDTLLPGQTADVEVYVNVSKALSSIRYFY